MTNYLLCAGMGYLLGSFNPSYLLSRLKGFDIRQKGSGNAGASNGLILFGKATGAVLAVLDILKACVAIWLAGLLFPDFIHAYAVAGTCCILGHIFPFYMGFKGGKGLASLGGMFIMLNWKVFLVALAAELVLVLAVDYICIVPITASLALPILYGVLRKDAVGAVIICVATLVILLKHMENLRRIREGSEMHLSFLWKPDQEMDRISRNLGEDAEAVREHFSK